MNFADRSPSIFAAAGGDNVKLFDVSAEHGDPCTLSYTPSPAFQVNSWWRVPEKIKRFPCGGKNGQSMGTIPVAGTDSGDNIEESIMAISFSNKGSRYLCSGGSGQVVRIWDLQRKRCIKWLRGHTDTITGAMYNCKDEHLASISLSGDLILHNLASGARAAELKDPNKQVLRALDYSRISRHLLVTAGDDGSVHLWDTTGRNPKVSWLKQHSAPTAGVSFSPSNDKVIASVGLDKKLYTFDSGSRRPSLCIPYEAPFSSLAFGDDGWILAAGTSSGRVVFYDIRAERHPLTVLRAYGNSEAVTSLCWQRSKPVLVNENNCTAEIALMGGAVEDSILMPDPLPSLTSSSLSTSVTTAGTRNPGRSGPFVESSSILAASSGFMSSSLNSFMTEEETPLRSTLWTGGSLARLHAPRSYNFKDDMEVFSPLVEVQPITPSLDKLWSEHEGAKKGLLVDKKPNMLFPSSNRRFPLSEEGGSDLHPIFDWKSSSTSIQLGATPTSTKSDDSSSITPPEAWGGERLSDKITQHHQSVTLPSRFATLAASSTLMSGSMFSGSQGLASPTSQTSMSYLTSSSLSLANLRNRDISSNQETSLGFLEHVPSSSSSVSPSLGTTSISGQSNLDFLGPALTLPRRFSTYAERIGNTPAFSDKTSISVGSPKTKKTGAETREELLNSLLSRSDISTATESASLASMNGGVSQPQRISSQPDTQPGTSFTLQLFQRTLEETLSSFQKSIHEDMRNLHIEILRQFHMQEMEMSSVMSSILENQAELMKEVQSLRKETQQLRQFL
ncbi:transducin/WD40 repeat-like superfamily protein [Actinidia rufa]|uniref:Transducin/WD40 repeat-like superfamily protein n=1 Tax=Actinidia rufa TaxID=165716 RepID=A0A7J0GW17_9ERIC|nr:transducin/WD40 repeat-like superfamily protein [Actinidia rufa]